jgi:hypothetical protein
MMDMFKVLSDTDANRVYFDATIRQSDMAVKGYERLTLSDRIHRALSVVGIGGDQSGKSKIFRESSAGKYLQQMPIVDGKFVFRGDIIHSADINSKFAPGVFRVDSIFTDKNGKATAKLIDLSNKDKKNQCLLYESRKLQRSK